MYVKSHSHYILFTGRIKRDFEVNGGSGDILSGTESAVLGFTDVSLMANGVQMVTPYQSNKFVFESIMVCAENDIRSDRFSDNLSDLSCLFSFTISIWVLGSSTKCEAIF